MRWRALIVGTTGGGAHGGVSTRGGSGSIGGVAIGAAILSTINIGLALMNVSQFWLQALTGLVILSAITIDIVIRRRITQSAV